MLSEPRRQKIMKIGKVHVVLVVVVILTGAAHQGEAEVEWCTYLGGSGGDVAEGIGLDAEGNVYVVGWTNSADFPTSSGAYDPTWNGAEDVFVAKFDHSGSRLLYSTLLGGAETDEGYGIAVDNDGHAYVTGATKSLDFPVTEGAFQSTHGGVNVWDVFVAKLSQSGGELIYSTYIGGDANDIGHSIAIDAVGSGYVTGYTNSDNYPTSLGAFDRTAVFWEQGFVTKLNATGSGLVYSTYLGGSKTFCKGIAVNSEGAAYVIGDTSDPNFPVTSGAFDTTYNDITGVEDGFVTKLDPSGSDLMYSSYLGGENEDFGQGIVLDGDDNVYVCGTTASPNFPITPYGLGPEYAGLNGFVTKFNSWGSSLIYSSYSAQEQALAIAVDGEGNACTGGQRAAVWKLNASGSRVLYSRLLDSEGSTIVHAIAVDAAGDIYVAGNAGAGLLTTPEAFDITFAGGAGDAFVAKLHPIGNPVTGSKLWQLYQ
jgi:hypothetical protein